MKKAYKNILIGLLTVAIVFVFAGIAYGGQFLMGKLFDAGKDKHVTRADFAVMMVEKQGVKDLQNYKNCADDVLDHPAEAELCYLAEKGAILVTDGKIHPNEIMLRKEAVDAVKNLSDKGNLRSKEKLNFREAEKLLSF